jgi:hypothetical protein
MTYRNTLIERSRIFESENSEPVVLDYLQLRNRQCLQAWHLRRVKHALQASTQTARAGAEPNRPTA